MGIGTTHTALRIAHLVCRLIRLALINHSFDEKHFNWTD